MPPLAHNVASAAVVLPRPFLGQTELPERAQSVASIRFCTSTIRSMWTRRCVIASVLRPGIITRTQPHEVGEEPLPQRALYANGPPLGYDLAQPQKTRAQDYGAEQEKK